MVEIDASVMEAVNKFLEKVKENGIPISSAYLFGSYALGKGSEWSDIDVAVVSEAISYDRLEERIRLMKLSAAVDSRIEPVPFRPDTFVDEDPLVWEIKRKGIPISLEG
jgi:predicted nucleotidyltransferase